MIRLIFLVLLLMLIPYCTEKEMTLSDALKYNKPVIVEFYSETCPICKKVSNEIEKLKKEFDEKFIFLKLNVAKRENLLLLSYYNDELTVPTIVIFDRNGKEVVIFKGYVDYKTLKRYLIEVI